MEKIDLKRNLISPERDKWRNSLKGINGRVCFSDALGVVPLLKRNMGKICKVYCEIGTYCGGTLIAAMHDENPCFFVGIDLFNGLFYNREDKVIVNKKNVQNNISIFNKHNHDYLLIEGNSHEECTFKKLDSAIEAIDLLLVDGDHSKKGVITDFEIYSPLVSNGGYIIFDDVDSEAWPGVREGINSIDFENNGFFVHGKYLKTFIAQKAER